MHFLHLFIVMTALTSCGLTLTIGRREANTESWNCVLFHRKWARSEELIDLDLAVVSGTLSCGLVFNHSILTECSDQDAM